MSAGQQLRTVLSRDGVGREAVVGARQTLENRRQCYLLAANDLAAKCEKKHQP
jgi:hypothetical protein